MLSLQSNAYLSERVTFYPASVILSHNPKPLTFYENTKLLNVHIDIGYQIIRVHCTTGVFSMR